MNQTQQTHNVILRIVSAFFIGVWCVSFVFFLAGQADAGSLAQVAQRSDSLNSTLVAERTGVDNSVATPAYDPVQALLDDAKQEHDEAAETQEISTPAEASAGNRGESAKKQDSASEGKSQDVNAAVKSVRLFNTVDLFKKPIAGNSPQWERVVNSEKKKKPIFGEGASTRMPANVLKRWENLRTKLDGATPMEKAKAVNLFFNQWPYKTDMDLWGVVEYWATPEEFIKRSGDCEDYAIAKYYALRALGIPAERLRIVAVKDTIRNIGHAVLAFYWNDTAYILDNLSASVLEHTRFSFYQPYFSVNENYRWGHARILKKGQAKK